MNTQTAYLIATLAFCINNGDPQYDFSDMPADFDFGAASLEDRKPYAIPYSRMFHGKITTAYKRAIMDGIKDAGIDGRAAGETTVYNFEADNGVKVTITTYAQRSKARLIKVAFCPDQWETEAQKAAKAAAVPTVSKVTLHKAEGAFSGSRVECGSLNEADDTLRFWARFMTSKLGYDKVDFSVYFDGDEEPQYVGRYDLKHWHQFAGVSIKRQMVGVVEWTAQNGCYPADRASCAADLPLYKALAED